MTDVLSHLDLVFCVDLTGSMTPFIAAARSQMVRVLEGIRDADLRVAIVGYRDFGTIQLLEICQFTKDKAATKRALECLEVKSPVENTDAAEAVFSGLEAVMNLPWRAGAYRVVVLVGDAPPHGCGADARPYPDRFKEDPTGMSLDDVANKLEEKGIFLHALGLTPSNTPMHDVVLERAFTRMAVGTGGAYHSARTGDAAMAVVHHIAQRTGIHLDFDRRLFALAEHDVEALARTMSATTDEVNAGLMRLRQRGLR
jgi:hypothetical protein